jgi:hypothetical protein
MVERIPAAQVRQKRQLVSFLLSVVVRLLLRNMGHKIHYYKLL